MSQRPEDNRRSKSTGVISLCSQSTGKTCREGNRQSAPPQVWPPALRLYLREQIGAARTRKEREAAVRLASELAARVG